MGLGTWTVQGNLITIDIAVGYFEIGWEEYRTTLAFYYQILGKGYSMLVMTEDMDEPLIAERYD